MSLTRTEPLPGMPLSYGMIGGGPGGGIGPTHLKALALDGLARLDAGCFTSDPERTRAAGRDLGLDPARVYDTAQDMARKEAEREDRIDFVTIVTPTFTHYAMSKAFLEQGFHVVCDKPLTLTVAEAEELAAMARERDLLFCVTHVYAGYPMVKQARHLVQSGELGEVRFINGEYVQDWLWQRLEETGHKQATWRMDPKRTGRASTLGDIGTHMDHLATYITGLKPRRILARVEALVPGRTMDDTSSIFLEYPGASGMFWLSQAAIGHDNGLKIRVMCSEGSLEWKQEAPDYLTVMRPGEPTQIVSRARTPLSPEAAAFNRFPAGHPEGYMECFANTYAAFCRTLLKRKAGLTPDAADLDFPGADEGVAGIRFLHACVDSSEQGCQWVEV